MYVPRINPLSSKTLAEEIAIARFIGGRLPYDVYIDLIRRGVIGKKKNRRASARRTTKRRDST